MMIYIKIGSNCNLCKSDEFEFLFSNYDRGYSEIKRSFNLFKCKNCGLIFIDPQPSSDELSDHYSNDYYSISEDTRITHLRKAFTLIQTFYQLCRIRSDESIFFRLINYLFYPMNSIFRGTNFVENGNFLDVGCGMGYFALIMKYLGMNPYGVEPTEFDEELSKQYNLRITRSTLHQAEYKNDFFDTITLNHVLEHVNDPSVVMLELNRILKPGGHLIIASPISDSLTFRIFGKYWAQIDTPRHLFIFSTETLKKYSEEFGFEVIDIRNNAIPSIPIVTSIIYFCESRRKRTYSRDLAQNPFLILLLLPVSLIMNLFRLGDSIEIMLVKKD
jgi:2-polyprenyl-3-methyl-5-hydroxy-6-metoxy-1,4-benzoquinol methylase